MAYSTTVLWIDHHRATVMSFDADGSDTKHLHESTHSTRQHGSDVRTGHEFFGSVCDALGSGDILVTGAHQAQADFRRYVDKHREPLAHRLVGWQTVDHPSEAQLLALARHFFAQRRAGAASAG